MKLTITRAGGFSGLERVLASADVSLYPASVANALRQRTEQLRDAIANTAPPLGADMLR